MMRKILLGAVVAIGAMMGMTGCKMVSWGGSSDSLLTDSVKFQQTDSLLSCVVSADVPAGTDSMAIGVRTFINAMLDSMSFATAFSSSPGPAYAGDPADGRYGALLRAAGSRLDAGHGPYICHGTILVHGIGMQDGRYAPLCNL